MELSAASLSVPRGPTPRAVVWHDLECGAYSADLPLWLELAAEAHGPVLDVGAGTGRVTLALARAGHEVTALDREEPLLQALRERAQGLRVQAVQADARAFVLPRSDYALCLVPMQTIQLLGGAAGRLAFLRHARGHLREGALLACAILGELEPFDCGDGNVGPEPESTTLDGHRYVSRAIRVSETRGQVRIERERTVMVEAASPPPWPFARHGSAEAKDAGGREPERDVVVLDAVDPATLRREGEAAGFSALPGREIAATDEHVSSEVVMLRAA